MPTPEQLYGRDRSLLVTGASTGIGAALAVRLARHGGRIALVARRGDVLAGVAEQVRAAGGQPLVLAGDVTDLPAVRELHARLQAEQGPVDVAFLNAGTGGPTSLRRFEAARVRELFEVNVFGVANWLEVLLPDMLARRSGVIAGISSLAAARGMPGSGAYAASKAAVSFLLESLRVEARAHGIQITTVEPGFVRTPLSAKNKFPMPFLMEVEPAVEIIAREVAHGRRVVRFPRAMAAVAGLLGVLPTPVFDRLGKTLIAKQRPPKAR
jgi:short-subunit dehydrogenase